MEAMLFGVRRIDMTDDSGRKIRGYSCFVGYPSPGVDGMETQKVFVSDELAGDCAWSPSVGKGVNVDFSPKGKLIRITNAK